MSIKDTHNIALQSLNFCRICTSFSFLIPNNDNLCVFPFFPSSPWLGFINSINHFTEPAFGFIEFLLYLCFQFHCYLFPFLLLLEVLIFNSTEIRGYILYDFNCFKFIEVCFMTQNKVNLGEGSLCT